MTGFVVEAALCVPSRTRSRTLSLRELTRRNYPVRDDCEMAVEQARVSRLKQLLAEDLLLLSLKPSGALRREARRSLGPALCGAVLVELVGRGRVLVHRDDVMLEPEAPLLGDELLDEALATIARAQRAGRFRGIGHWVLDAPAHGRWRDRVAERLVERGVLARERRTLLGLFPRWRYPVVDRAAGAGVAERLRAALDDQSAPKGRDLVLVSLAHACGLVAPLFPHAERREVKRRMKELTSEERMGREVSAAVAEVQAAAATGAVYAGDGAGDCGGGAGGGGGGGGC